jgi:hypothetical protein
MDTRLEIQNFGEGRKKVTICIELSEEENRELDRKTQTKHADSELPIPCQFFQNENPEIKIAQGTPNWNSKPYKAYFLKTARRVLMNRGVPGKTLIRIPIPGILELGYINKSEEEKLIKWWKETKKSITNQMQEKIYAVSSQQKEFKPETPRVVDESKVNLNPLNPNEKGGVRKRCLDIF